MPGGSPRERAAQQRFAEALDRGATHLDDQEFAAELAVVSALRRAGAAAARQPVPRERIAAQLTTPEAPTPEGTAPETTAPKTTAPETTAPRAAAREADAPQVPEPRKPAEELPRRRRRLPVLAAAACLVLALLGLGALLSEHALPGEPLYDVKRLREAAAVQLTFDAEARALRRLEHAENRLDELDLLTQRPGDTTSGFAVALADFDADTRAAVAGLIAVATSSDGQQLAALRAWAERQAERLAALRPALPADLAHQHADATGLLTRVGERASALAGRMDCYQITSGQADELGALPFPGACGRPTDPPAGAPPPRTPAPHESAVPSLRVTEPADAARLTTNTPSIPSPAPSPSESGYTPRQWVPAPPPDAVPRPRLPDSVPDPPAVVSVPPVLPGLPEIRVG
ncbi:hypothetical protein SAMN05421810_10717 [Amycolatopsis arida]|uniref:DUF5667 domain-containing protein n=1 Tax=Amycolatopsis arida TaxID=587909 RepID=A0A1I5YAD8_9PSEU|nr:DUF5667 domain-containing protein [Amycolatopsis arida]TDX90373.1 hypothetical protein CLV69_10717 [Amycolatopsis arida]SFQ40887.1 hypothetical protein SAMN05421810_10717 [Amycolatopsis arida]